MKNKYDEVMRRLGAYYVTIDVPTSEEAVQEFERTIGYQLPSDYRAFLLKYGFGAGRPFVRYPKIGDPSGPAGYLPFFYGLRPGDPRDLLHVRQAFAGRLPERLLPITPGPRGHLCLSLAGEDAGRLYWWEENNSPDIPLVLVAHDFDSFLHSLRCSSL